MYVLNSIKLKPLARLQPFFRKRICDFALKSRHHKVCVETFKVGKTLKNAVKVVVPSHNASLALIFFWFAQVGKGKNINSSC